MTLTQEVSYSYARVRELWRFSISQGDHLCAWLHPPPSRYDRRTSLPVAVFHGGERHDALSELLTADPDAFAVFTGDGQRLLVISATKGLEVFDPLSQHPTRPLLTIPIANSGGSTTAELHSSDERLAVAIGTSVVMFDVSGGN
jgi:hypothetical protein